MASILEKDLMIIYTELLIFIIILIDKSVIVLSSDFSSVKKCCSIDSVLTQKDGIYSCESGVEGLPELFSRIPGEEGKFPVCQNGGSLTIIPFSDFNIDDHFINADFCADIYLNFNGTDSPSPVVLFCDNSIHDSHFKQRPIPTLLRVRRCCPHNEVFKIENRACLPYDLPQEDISTASLVKNIGSSDFIYAIRGPPNCQHAIVDYEVNATDISIVDGRLQVTASNSYDVVNLLATEESACLDVGSSPGLLVVRACRGVEYCRGNACLRKCCPEDQALVDKTCQKLASHLTLARWHSEVWALPEIMKNTTNKLMNTTEYGLLLGNPCMHKKYALSQTELWYIVTGGKLLIPAGSEIYGHDQYCTDMFYNNSQFPEGFYPFVCFQDPFIPNRNGVKTRFRVNAYLALVSCVFLLMTLFVYICLPTLRNLHGKTLMCHVTSLLMAFTCLVMVAVASPKDDKTNADLEKVLSSTALCKFLGYTMLFSFLSAFSWLNVMCFDIWWKFGSLRHSGRTNTKRRDDYKRFLLYCLYAWGLALGFVIITVIADHVKFLPNNFQPVIGAETCWFSTGRAVYGEVLFFTGPVFIQLLINLVFFILTARKCSMVKAEIQRRVMVDRSDPRNRKFEADKTKLILNIKLFVVMGIWWTWEFISNFLTNYGTDIELKEEFFYAPDVINCLQGVMIFVLFVLKKKVLHALKRRFTKAGNRRASTGGILDPYRVRKSPSSSTILSTFVVSSSPSNIQ